MTAPKLEALHSILEKIEIYEDAANNIGEERNSEKETLIPKPKHTKVSITDSDDSDESEFDDIVRRHTSGSPRSAHHEENRVSNSGTILHLLKANIFTGLLAMPKAMSHFGLLAGILGIFIMGAIYIYCIHVLLDVNRAVVQRVMMDQDVKKLKLVLKDLEKKYKKQLKKENKMKNVAGYFVSAAEETTTNRENSEAKVVADIEAEEPSSSKQDNSNKKTGNWEAKFVNDFEVGESSSTSSKEDNSKKNPAIPKEKEENIKPPSSKQEEDPNVNSTTLDEKEKNIKPAKPSASKQEDPDEITELEGSVKVDTQAAETSASNQDNSNRDVQEENDSIKKDVEEILTPIFRRKNPYITLDYPKLVELSFHFGFKSNRWCGKIVKFYVQMLMFLTHIGCCCVCFLFVAETLAEIAMNGQFIFHSNSFQMVAYAIPIMICLSFIPDRHELTGVSTVAFLLQLCGILMMLYYFFEGEHSDSLHLYIAPAETWYLYFGIIFYAFEGTGVTLHLESHMENKQDFRGWKGVLNKSMYFVIPLFAVFGGLGYWKMGNAVKTSVTFNLPEERITDLIQIMTALGILLTYPFHLSFVLTPIRKTFIHEDLSDRTKNILDLFLRAVFVICTFLMSALVPYLELQLTVLGAVASCFLILVIPTFMSVNSFLFLPDLEYSNWRLALHAIIMLIGIAGTGLGSYTTFKNLPLYYPNSTIFG